MKNIVKSITFLIILCIGFIYIFKILWISPTSVYDFYKEPNNSLDVVYIGSSNAYIHFNTTLAYNLYGFTTGMLSADAQPFVLTEYLIKETEKYQKPNLYVIDIAKLAGEPKDDPEGNIRKTIDCMKFSKNRIDAINATLEHEKIDRKESVNWYFSFLVYHNKWKSITKNNIIRDKSLYKGYLFKDMVTNIEPQETYHWSADVMQLQEENKQILIKLIDYIKSNNLNVLFVVPKRVYEKEINAKLNDGIKIIEDNNLNVINCNTLKELDNIDFNTDFYNKAHLNVYGSTKYTLYFAKYLNDNYHLENHKNDNRYNSWNQEYERFKLDFKTKMNEDFDELLLEYSSL